jgi:hypothetical protein
MRNSSCGELDARSFEALSSRTGDVLRFDRAPTRLDGNSDSEYNELSSVKYREKDETWVGGRVECVSVDGCSCSRGQSRSRTRLSLRTEAVLRPATTESRVQEITL